MALETVAPAVIQPSQPQLLSQKVVQVVLVLQPGQPEQALLPAVLVMWSTPAEVARPAQPVEQVVRVVVAQAPPELAALPVAPQREAAHPMVAVAVEPA